MGKMLIRFTKGTENKASTLHCIRADGSISWTKLQSALEFHDLAHYVVETELGFVNAFYGLLNMGFSIEDFELPREQRPTELIPANLPHQALQTEHIVNLLQTVHNSSDTDIDFIFTLRQILEEKQIPHPEVLDRKSLGSIQFRLVGLLHKWEGLEPGASIDLPFQL